MPARPAIPRAEALAAYARIRPRLPAARFPDTSREATHLLEIAEDFDALLLDAFGVLNIGETAIPGAPARIAALRAAGKRLLVLTNGATHRAEETRAKLAALGFDFAPEEVISSRDALVAALALRRERRWGVMAPDAAGLDTLGVPEAVPLRDDPEPYETAEGFVLLGSAGWTDARQARLVAALRARPRPLLVGNPDLVAPREGGLTPEPGWFAHLAADATGVAPEFYGKPFGNVFSVAFQRLGLGADPARTLMVGDTPHTDILGGAAAGTRTALIVSHGLLRGGDWRGALAASGIRPDFVLETT